MSRMKFCDKCGLVLDGRFKVKVTADGCYYCFKNKCAYGIPEEKK